MELNYSTSTMYRSLFVDVCCFCRHQDVRSRAS